MIRQLQQEQPRLFPDARDESVITVLQRLTQEVQELSAAKVVSSAPLPSLSEEEITQHEVKLAFVFWLG